MGKETITHLTLDVFDPQKGYDEIKNTTLDAGLIPMDSVSVRALIQAAETKPPEYFLTPRGEKVKERANTAVYSAIEKIYDLDRNIETPQTFWREHMSMAGKQLRTLVHEFTPDVKDKFGLKNKVQITPDPAEAILFLKNKSSTKDKRTDYELTRHLGLAMIAAELDVRSRDVEKRLKKVDEIFDIYLFNEKPDEDRTILAMHDNATNEVTWVSGTSIGENRESIPNAHLKVHTQTMRYAGEKIGWVLSDARKKEEAVNKTVRKAILREKKGEGNTLDPINDVPDMMGMQFVVGNEFSSKGDHAGALVEKITELLTKHFEVESITKKPFNSGAEFQSGKVEGDRYMVEFADMKTPLEILIFGQGEYLNNTYHLGTIDETETGKPNGPAHTLMEVDRGTALLERFLPEEIYGRTNWNEIKQTNYAATIKKYKEAHRAVKDSGTSSEEITLFDSK